MPPLCKQTNKIQFPWSRWPHRIDAAPYCIANEPKRRNCYSGQDFSFHYCFYCRALSVAFAPLSTLCVCARAPRSNFNHRHFHGVKANHPIYRLIFIFGLIADNVSIRKFLHNILRRTSDSMQMRQYSKPVNRSHRNGRCKLLSKIKCKTDSTVFWTILFLHRFLWIICSASNQRHIEFRNSNNYGFTHVVHLRRAMVSDGGDIPSKYVKWQPVNRGQSMKNSTVYITVIDLYLYHSQAIPIDETHSMHAKKFVVVYGIPKFTTTARNGNVNWFSSFENKSKLLGNTRWLAWKSEQTNKEIIPNVIWLRGHTRPDDPIQWHTYRINCLFPTSQFPPLCSPINNK